MRPTVIPGVLLLILGVVFGLFSTIIWHKIDDWLYLGSDGPPFIYSFLCKSLGIACAILGYLLFEGYFG